jgi:hypothetical protein
MEQQRLVLSKYKKQQLLQRCEELGITRCKSKNKSDLIDLIIKKQQITFTNQEKDTQPVDICVLMKQMQIHDDVDDVKEHITQSKNMVLYTLNTITKSNPIPKHKHKPDESSSFIAWKLKMTQINQEYCVRSAFPKWLYEIRNVHKEMLKKVFRKKSIRKYTWIIPNPF